MPRRGRRSRLAANARRCLSDRLPRGARRLIQRRAVHSRESLLRHRCAAGSRVLGPAGAQWEVRTSETRHRASPKSIWVRPTRWSRPLENPPVPKEEPAQLSLVSIATSHHPAVGGQAIVQRVRNCSGRKFDIVDPQRHVDARGPHNNGPREGNPHERICLATAREQASSHSRPVARGPSKGGPREGNPHERICLATASDPATWVCVPFQYVWVIRAIIDR